MEEPADSLAPPQDEPESTGRGVWQWVGAMAGFVIAATIVGGLLFKVPYVALTPGSARDTEPLVDVVGLERFPSDGELLLTTVQVKQRLNLWEYLWLRADRDTEFVAEDIILGGRSAEENRTFNLQLMTDSKSVAIAVALEELGYDAITSDGVLIVELVEGGAASELLVLGDTVVAIDDAAVNTTGDLVETLSRYSPGDEIVLTVEPLEPELERILPPSAIPTPTVDEADEHADAEPAADVESDSEPEPEPEPVATTVVVLDGESVWEIAESVWIERTGTGPTEAETTALWAEIIELNRDRLVSPDLITPGQILELPEPAAAVADGDRQSERVISEPEEESGPEIDDATASAEEPTTGEREPADVEKPGTLRIAVVLGAKPDEPDAAFLGVGPTDRIELSEGFDFEVDIDSGSVGGPSAGLAFTLAVLDELTAGELTGGATVAVTGTIDVGGHVGPVGGVIQKTAAVRNMGADVFLVPAGLPEAELAQVMDRAGDDLEIIPVETLDDALTALAGLGGEVAALEEYAASNLS